MHGRFLSLYAMTSFRGRFGNRRSDKYNIGERSIVSCQASAADVHVPAPFLQYWRFPGFCCQATGRDSEPLDLFGFGHATGSFQESREFGYSAGSLLESRYLREACPFWVAEFR